MAGTSLAIREQLAQPLLELHSYTSSYLSTLCFHEQLYEFYTQQEHNISRANLHHMAMAHQRYLNGAAMATVHAHTQSVAAHGLLWVPEENLAFFCKALHGLWREYDRRVRDHHRYAKPGGHKNVQFSQAASMSAQQHLVTPTALWMATSNHWLASVRSQKEHHLAAKADIVRRLPVKRNGTPCRRARPCAKKRGTLPCAAVLASNREHAAQWVPYARGCSRLGGWSLGTSLLVVLEHLPPSSFIFYLGVNN